MAVRIGNASKDENNGIKDGTSGDQTGKEVYIRNWYLHSKGWVVLRCKEPAKRERIAEAMEKACANDQIGYDQNQRTTLFTNVKDKGFDPSRTTKNVETDCSALVRVCIAYAYGEDVAGNIRTVSEPEILVETGLFEKLTADKYCKSSDYLLRGDILCTPVSGHTVVVLDDGVEVEETEMVTYCVQLPVLKKGYKVDSVRAMQLLLMGYGCDCGSSGADGSFGGATESALKRFQEDNALEVDGKCGPKTWGKLLGIG